MGSNCWECGWHQDFLSQTQRHREMSFDIEHCNEDMDIDIPLDFSSKAQEVTDYRFIYSLQFTVGATNAESTLPPLAP